MSAQLVAAAMYKPVELLKWNENFNWLPVPVHSESLDADRVIFH